VVGTVSNCALGWAVTYSTYDYIDLRIALGNPLVGWLAVIGDVGGNRSDFVLDLI
jgi:hypothetical protein